MAEGQVAIRFSVEDEETVRKALDNLGRDGEAALRRLDAAAKAPQAGLSALDKVAGGLKDRIIGLALSIGPVGQVLVALGPVGVAAAAGLGALFSVLGKVSEAAHRLSENAAHIRDFAEVANISTDQVQALVEAGAKLGRSPEEVQTFVEKFSTQVEQLKRGTGELLNQLSRVDPELARQVAGAKTVAEAWDLVAKAYKSADDAGDTFRKNAIARAIGGNRGGLQTGGLLGATANAGGLENLANNARNAGIVIDRDLVLKLATLRREIDQTGADAQRIFASIFSLQLLEGEKVFAETLKEIARFLKSIADERERLRSQSPQDRGFEDAGRQLQTLYDKRANINNSIISADDPDRVRKLASELLRVDLLIEQIKTKQDKLVPRIMIDVPGGGPNVPLPRSRPGAGQNLGTPSAEFLLNRPGGLREQAAVLGSAITPTERLELAETELNAAVEKNRDLTAAAARGLAARTLAEDQLSVATRERLGIATQDELSSIRARELDDQATKGYLSNAGDRANAERIVAKEIRATLDAQAVRGAQFSGLKQLEVDAENLDKQLDSLGTGLTSNVSSGLVDITLSADGAGAGLKRLEQQLARTALQMIYNVSVGRFLSTIMQGIFGAISPAAGVLPDGLPLGKGGIGHNAAGTDDWRGGWTWVGERGPELLNVSRGAQIVPNHRLGAGGGSPSIVPVQNGPSVVVHNYGDQKAEATTSRGPDGREMVEVFVGEVKNRMARGHFDSVGSARWGLKRNVVKRG